MIAEAQHETVRSEIRALLRPGQQKLRWHDESDKSRAQITQAVAALSALHVIVVRAGHAGERTERRRRKCLERLVYELDGLGVVEITAEAREQKANARELRYFDQLRSAGVIGTRMRLYHVAGPVEPLLWLADVAAGAVGAARSGAPHHLEHLVDLADVVVLDVDP